MSYLKNSTGNTKPFSGCSVNWGHPLAHGLVGAYLATERSGSVIYDVVAGDALAFQSTAPTWQGDRVFFDSASSAFASSAAPIIAGKLTNTPFTVVLSTQDPQFVNSGALVSLGSSASSNNLFHIRTPSSTSILFGMFSNDLTVTVPDMTGQTVHIVCTLDSKFNQTIYLNGTYIGERNSGAFGGFLPLLNLSKFGNFAQYSSQKFNHLLFYDRALTAGEVSRLYADQYGAFSGPRAWSAFVPTSNNYTGTSAVTAPAATLSSSGNIVNAYTGTSAVTAAAATMAATGTVVNPATNTGRLMLLGIG
jgi:hypothetical protein